MFGIEHFLNKIKEDNYKRIRREPLGKSLNRDYVFPEAVGKENFKFGFPSIKCIDLNYISNKCKRIIVFRKLFS